MALTLQTEAPDFPGNVVGYRKVILAAATGDAGDFGFALNPLKRTAISVLKPTDGAVVSLSNTTHKKSGVKITSIDDADIIWQSRSTGVDPYFVGDERGISFVKVESASDATGTDIEISITQF